MSRHDPLPDLLRKAFGPSPRGVVGLVDDLLGVCRGGRLRLEFRDDRCHAHIPDAGDSFDLPIPKTAFRAVLARIAALCNERSPDSVTPYHGNGEIADPSDPSSVVRVAFTNTASEQRLELYPVTGHAVAPGDAGRLTSVG